MKLNHKRTTMHDTTDADGAVNAVSAIKPTAKGSSSKERMPTPYKAEKARKYEQTVEIGQGVSLVALFDTGSSDSFLDEEFERRKKLRVDTLDLPHVYRQGR